MDPSDSEILRYAHATERVLVTLDKDFGELAVHRGQKHSGIARLVGFGARQQGAICLVLLETYAEELARGALLSAAPGRVRIRRPGA